MHMRTTIILDPALLKQAKQVTKIARKTDLVHAGLRSLIREAALEHLADLYGKGKAFAPAPRRRAAPSGARAA